MSKLNNLSKEIKEKLPDCTIRDVTTNDKWCRQPVLIKGKPAFSKEDKPFGIIVVLEKYYDGLELKFPGYIIRSKKIRGKLHLQVVPGRGFHIHHYYRITLTVKEILKKKDKKIKGKRKKEIDKRKRKSSYVRILNIKKV